LMAKVAHPEQLKRTELKQKQADSLRLAQQQYADHLAGEIARRSQNADAANVSFVPWLTVEKLYLDTLTDRNLPQVAQACLQFLGPKPPQPKKTATEEEKEPKLDQILQHRYLVTALNVAARKNADPAFSARLLQYFEQGITPGGEQNTWKLAEYQLLIALDRPKELEQALRQWIRGGDADSRWRLALGYLLAEQGKLAEAIKTLESIESADDLGSLAYRALAGWYLVENRRAQHERATLAMYRTMDERTLHRLLYTRLRPWQRT